MHLLGVHLAGLRLIGLRLRAFSRLGFRLHPTLPTSIAESTSGQNSLSSLPALSHPGGREEPDRIELLAACVMRLKAPRPGPDSFASCFMMELRTAASTGKPFSAARLARRLAKADSGMAQSPYYLPLQAEGHNKPIILKLLFQTAETSQSPHEVACLLTFHVSMSEKLTMNILPNIVKWLRDGAPDVVSDLSIKEVIVNSEKLHEFAFTQPGIHHPFLFQKLDDVAKHDILDTWNGLCKFIASADAELATPISKGYPAR